MGRLTIVLFPLMAAALLLIQGAQCSKDEQNLIRHLFQPGVYAKDIRPQRDRSSPVRINFGLALINILDIKHNNRSADVDVKSWYRFLWYDYRLVWEPADFGGLTVLRLPSSMVWKSDVILYDGLDSSFSFDPVFNVLVYSSGDVLWIPSKIDKLRCAKRGEDLDCKMRFGSWTYDGYMIQLGFYEGLEKLDLSDFNDLSDYRVTNNTGKFYNVIYPCCEETYPNLTFNFTLSP